ncbi:hypothetical protein [Phenylobacterium sp. SCN 70-31]|uniref:hypothetical protein n=1 Tax=Phenylobacterium sp. SCN 70-31 TaxID=1660129 RepID=UPI0025E9737A|nr:hypothetical protein [Phenylobacterium sp. SCN 70-31]
MAIAMAFPLDPKASPAVIAADEAEDDDFKTFVEPAFRHAVAPEAYWNADVTATGCKALDCDRR